jgi:hypothetical protein
MPPPNVDGFDTAAGAFGLALNDAATPQLKLGGMLGFGVGGFKLQFSPGGLAYWKRIEN